MVPSFFLYFWPQVISVSRLRKGTAGKYRTAKGRFYDCRSSIEALVTDEYHEVPYWTRTIVEHNGEDYHLVGYKGLFMDGLFYMFTDVRTSATELLMAGERAELLITRAFDSQVHDGMAFLPGVVSRKKQMIPALMGAIKELTNEE